jgi:ribosomal protein S18 acetylase RimI-like enzyme
MGLTYFKRYRMEIDLTGRDLSWPVLAPGYRLWAWGPSLLDAHAEAKYYSFCDELDSNVFPCLGEQEGCRRLMAEISRKPGFLPEATWLLVYTDPLTREQEYCGTIQGIRDRAGWGAIQNLGVVAEHRNRGLGTGLLFQSLQGFRHVGLNRVYLEVTAENEGATRLYRRRGFTTVKTVFKAAEVLVS